MTNTKHDFSKSLNDVNVDENWIKIDKELKKKFKHQIKKILLINPPQFQTSFINLEILKNKRFVLLDFLEQSSAPPEKRQKRDRRAVDGFPTALTAAGLTKLAQTGGFKHRNLSGI